MLIIMLGTVPTHIVTIRIHLRTRRTCSIHSRFVYYLVGKSRKNVLSHREHAFRINMRTCHCQQSSATLLHDLHGRVRCAPG